MAQHIAKASHSAFHRVWALAWPLILSNITVPLLGLVDTAVMGHLPRSEYLGAVTLGATLFSFFYWGFGFLRMGTTGFAAQAHGHGQGDSLRLLLAQALLIALLIGVVLILLHPLVIPLGLILLNGSDEVSALAGVYAHWRIASAPAVLANYVIVGWFLGLGRSRVMLVLMLVNNATNILLDLTLVVGLGWNIEGVALATVMADYLTLAVGLSVAWLALEQIGGRLPHVELWTLRAYARLLSVNGALFLRTLCLLFAIAFFHAQGARMGDGVLAANAVLMQFVLLTSYALDGFAHAAEALVGQAIGRGGRRRLVAIITAATWWSILAATGAAAFFAVAGDFIIAALTDIPRIRALAGDYLPWLVLMPLIAVWSYLLDGIFIGATRTRAMRDTMLICVVCVYLPAWYLSQPLGNHGLWLAFTIFTLARSLSLGLVFRHQHYGAAWLSSSFGTAQARQP